MRVERDQPDLLQRQAKPEEARAGHRIIAADQQGQHVPLDAGLAGRGDRRSRFLDAEAGDGDVAMVGDLGLQFLAGLDIVAADPPQRRAQQSRR